MKNLSQTQFFVAALVLVVVIALVAVLADGLKKYDQDTYQAEMQATEMQKTLPPNSPEAIGAELKSEEADATAAAAQELANETAELQAEAGDLNKVTEGYE
jgi:hypothetical protein